MMPQSLNNTTDPMDEALQEAFHGSRKGDGGPFGAVVIRNGIVVGRGHNRVVIDNDPTAHAEMVAIRDATTRLGRFHLEDCELYTTCEPCPMCLSAIYWARIPVFYYGCTRDDAAAIGFDDNAMYRAFETGKFPFTRIQKGYKECLVPFKEWSLREMKIFY